MTAKERARTHARRSWTCTICALVVWGNGGKASHQRAHLRAAGRAVEPLRQCWIALRREEQAR